MLYSVRPCWFLIDVREPYAITSGNTLDFQVSKKLNVLKGKLWHKCKVAEMPKTNWELGSIKERETIGKVMFVQRG